MLEITKINVKKVERDESRLKGYASVVLNDSFAINDIRIIEGDKGLFTAMPSRKTSIGEYKDIAHPINQETRKMFDEVIIAEFNKAE